MTTSQAPWVIKVSGHELDQPSFLSDFAQCVRQLIQSRPVIIVHGGGKEISDLQNRLGIEPRYIDGLRITDGPSLALVEMVLSGLVNKRLVRTLLAHGVPTLGLSGVDMGIVQAEKMPHIEMDMGFTGHITGIDLQALQALLALNAVLVIAPVAYHPESNFNVNADHVAGALGSALHAEQIIFLTNVPGVMAEDAVIAHLTPAETEAYITREVITGGMIPKVRTALDVIARGADRVVITNLDGLLSGSGTTFINHDEHTIRS